MATRNQVLSLFGATPEQVMQAQRQRQAEFISSRSDPYQTAGAAIGVGLSRLFGGKSEEMQAAEQMQEAIAGVDPNDPAALRELAQTVSSFAPERALQIAAYAGELEKSKQGAVVNVPTKVGQKPIYKQDAKTLEWSIVGYEDQYENIPHERTAEGLVPLVDISQYGAKAATDTGVATGGEKKDTTSRFIWTRETGRIPNPNYVEPGADTQGIISNVTPEAEQAIMQQQGPRGGFEGAQGIAPPPQIQGEITYMNPEVLGEEITRLESQLSAMGRTSAGRKELQSRINKLKAQQRKFKKQSSGGQARRNR